MAKRAMIVWGGWDGHEPEQVAGIFARVLREEGFEVAVHDTLDAFANRDAVMAMDLIIPNWTMGTITNEQLQPLLSAVENGTGLAGCHGGMGDAFRDSFPYQFMTGGQFVAHPGNDVRYTVRMGPGASPITQGIKDFDVTTEQYYMHYDPAIKVLATTRAPVVDGPHSGNGQVDMPVIWTKLYGMGRVFYNSLGHNAAIVAAEPNLTLMRRGFLWASR